MPLLNSLEPMVELLGGSLKKKSMNTIPFNAEIRTLAYVMIHNLYPVTNLTTLFGPILLFSYMISSPIRRSTYAIIYTTS